MGPDKRESSLQLEPNWNAMTMPETTPSPKATPKILSQNSKTTRYAGRPVARWSASSTVSHAASPIVNDGKMMWNEIVNANCSRDRSKAVTSIAASLAPQVHLREIDVFVAPTAGQVRLATGGEGGNLFLPNMSPLDFLLPPSRIAKAVQTIAGDAVDTFGPRRREPIDKLVSNRFWHICSLQDLARRSTVRGRPRLRPSLNFL